MARDAGLRCLEVRPLLRRSAPIRRQACRPSRTLSSGRAPHRPGPCHPRLPGRRLGSASGCFVSPHHPELSGKVRENARRPADRVSPGGLRPSWSSSPDQGGSVPDSPGSVRSHRRIAAAPGLLTGRTRASVAVMAAGNSAGLAADGLSNSVGLGMAKPRRTLAWRQPSGRNRRAVRSVPRAGQ